MRLFTLHVEFQEGQIHFFFAFLHLQNHFYYYLVILNNVSQFLSMFETDMFFVFYGHNFDTFKSVTS